MGCSKSTTVPLFEPVPHPDVVQVYKCFEKKTPLIIDNGSFSCKVGWASEPEPSLNFPSKSIRTKIKGRLATIVGNDILDPESSKYSFRTLFDRGVVTNFSTQEDLFDYAFAKLGINSSSISHPVVITETVCNFFYCRERMAELLFECYGCPSLTFGVDGLFSFYHSNVINEFESNMANGLVISCSHSATHILPIIDGSFDVSNARRLSFSGLELSDYLTKLLHLKYPQHKSALQGDKIKQIQNKLFVAEDYTAELKKWTDESYHSANEIVFQLPFVVPESSGVPEEEKRRRREEQSQRIKEYIKSKREKQLAELSERLVLYRTLEKSPSDAKVKAKMKEAGIKNVVNLEKNIRLVKQSIIKVEAKLNGHSEPPEEEIKKEYVFDLINVSDSELDSDQLKEKKKQLFLKNAAEGRERAKKIRQQLQQEKEEQDAQLELRRQNNPEQYLQELKDMRSKLMRRREMRKKRREELNDRRSQASKQRMRLIVQQTQTAKGKKDKAKRRKQEDLFGVNDSDFDIYRNISKESDSESEHEQEELLKIEELLFKYDPDYKSVDEPLTIEEYHQLRLGTEAFRAPELLFQPAIFGSDRAGLIESIEWLLKSYPSEQQEKLCQNVHVCGGLAGLSGLAERIRRELIMIRPVGAVINVTTASNPLYSAWQGAREWTVREEDEFHSLLLSKEDFMERGLDNLKEHRFSNIYRIRNKS